MHTRVNTHILVNMINVQPLFAKLKEKSQKPILSHDFTIPSWVKDGMKTSQSMIKKDRKVNKPRTWPSKFEMWRKEKKIKEGHCNKSCQYYLKEKKEKRQTNKKKGKRKEEEKKKKRKKEKEKEEE